jgi:hypothetical protein
MILLQRCAACFLGCCCLQRSWPSVTPCMLFPQLQVHCTEACNAAAGACGTGAAQHHSSIQGLATHLGRCRWWCTGWGAASGHWAWSLARSPPPWPPALGLQQHSAAACQHSSLCTASTCVPCALHHYAAGRQSTADAARRRRSSHTPRQDKPGRPAGTPPSVHL